MTTLLFGLARGISKTVHDSHNRDNHASNTPRQTTIMTLPPSQSNPEYAAPAHVPRDEPPPPYTEVAPPEARIPQPQTQAPSRMPTQRRTQPQPQGPSQPQPVIGTPNQAQTPTRNASQSQSRPEQMKRAPSQSQPPTRTQSQSQSQPQRSASTIRHRAIIPSYQQPPSQEPAGYVVVDAVPGLDVCDCVYKDGFGLAPKCRRCERQARRGHQGTGERRRRRQRDGPTYALVDEMRR
ncbi:hypothetical protein BGZ57DRAFT_934637 [Hyaloscypha finlandica]|nr:hypothetical protein BGZ57DRAFT_934637 [Hyaloscypha finlandica]